jgi:penicillin-binding protein 1A
LTKRGALRNLMHMAESKRTIILHLFLGFSALAALTFGIALGLALAATLNNPIQEFDTYQVALPSQILDRNGKLITEFFSDEKREIVSIDELPKHLIYAIITREDKDFFTHKGVSIKGNIRAALNILTGRYFSGASTITQLTVGQLGYVDRTDISITRKLKEMWYALQLERILTKNEILEILLNGAYFGNGTFGVEAASQFYFGHSARELTLAESVLLVIQIAAPGGKHSPLRNPDSAQAVQQEILAQMVELGYTTKEEAERSFMEYWSGYDYTRPSTTSAFVEREDKAPWFSEYVRTQLDQLLLGSSNYYRDGFIVHTTLDLDYQRAAEEAFNDGLTQVNREFQKLSGDRSSFADTSIVPIIDMLSLAFDIDQIRVAGARERQNAIQQFQNTITPALDMLAMTFGIDELKYTANMTYLRQRDQLKRTMVEGALITIENDTGYILAMIGGSKFEGINQFNRAMQGKIEPGSSFKPLYYSAALDTGKFTPATAIWDGPVVFHADDGKPYTPTNYKGEWEGWVLLRQALSHSMNVPSIKVLDTIGFDAAINRASMLLGMTSPNEIASFPRKYPLGLGVISVSPLQMARAFATFATGGQEVVPITIRYIEDRNGMIVLEPEKDVRLAQKKKGRDAQLISPQNAYLMTDLLQTTVQTGTLAYARNYVGGFGGMPMAGKTGTTQNWADAWTVGFSPYMTTALWYGFEKGGSSLGVSQTGATISGPAWARFMKAVHRDLPVREFPKPTSGISEVTVCAVSGKLPTEACTDGTIKEKFLVGTEPAEFCDIHEFQTERNEQIIARLQSRLGLNPLGIMFDGEPLPSGLIPEIDPSLELPGLLEDDDELDNRLLDRLPFTERYPWFYDSQPDGTLAVPEEEEYSNPLLD